jgi:hypothetical protein
MTNTTSDIKVVYGRNNQEQEDWLITDQMLDFQLDELVEDYAEKKSLNTQLNMAITLLSKVVNNQAEEIRLLRLLLSKK